MLRHNLAMVYYKSTEEIVSFLYYDRDCCQSLSKASFKFVGSLSRPNLNYFSFLLDNHNFFCKYIFM